MSPTTAYIRLFYRNTARDTVSQSRLCSSPQPASTPTHSTGQPFAVLILDLDHFKLFNDTFGHQAGDAALRAVAQAVQKSLRAADVVARYGGEEFVVILPQTDAGTAFEIAERLRQVVAGTSLPDPQRPAEYLPPLTVSVGVAVCPAHATTLGTLLHAADAAMYAARQAGRNRVVVAQAE